MVRWNQKRRKWSLSVLHSSNVKLYKPTISLVPSKKVTNRLSILVIALSCTAQPQVLYFGVVHSETPCSALVSPGGSDYTIAKRRKSISFSFLLNLYVMLNFRPACTISRKYSMIDSPFSRSQHCFNSFSFKKMSYRSTISLCPHASGSISKAFRFSPIANLFRFRIEWSTMQKY